MSGLERLQVTLSAAQALAAALPLERGLVLAGAIGEALDADLVALATLGGPGSRGPRADAIEAYLRLLGGGARLVGWAPPEAPPALLGRRGTSALSVTVEGLEWVALVHRADELSPDERQTVQRLIRLGAPSIYPPERALIERPAESELGFVTLSPQGEVLATTSQAADWLSRVDPRDVADLLRHGPGLYELELETGEVLSAELDELADHREREPSPARSAGLAACGTTPLGLPSRFGLVLSRSARSQERESRLDLARRRVSELPLTPREAEVACLAALGRSNHEIARELGLSPNTVKTHLAAIYRKTELRGRDRLAAFLLQQRA